MIQARIRRIIQGADYSAQEPRVMTQLCGDEGMLQAYREGKDLYVEIASIAWHKPYKMCLEHFPKGCPIKQVDGHWEYAKLKTGEEDDIKSFTDIKRYLAPDFDPELYDYDKLADGEVDTFKEGKELRAQSKRILLGIMYGRGEKSIAEQLGCTVEEAREIKNNVYIAFPRIKEFEKESSDMVKAKGYVSTLWGRRRRLGDYNLPPIRVFYVDKDGKELPTPVPQSEKDRIVNAINYARWNERDGLHAKFISQYGIDFEDNQSKIAAAGRQIINSRVQGSAADMSKLALIKIYQDEELQKRKVKEIIPVHDEILIETPLRYANYVKARFANDMETAAKPVLSIPVKCDVVSSYRWYGEELDASEVLGDLPDV